MERNAGKEKKVFRSIRAIVMSMIPVLCLLLGNAPAYAAEEDKDVENTDFIITLEAGIDGVLVEEKAAPVAVTIRSIATDFDGTLRVIVPTTYDQRSLAYEKAITVPSGGEKTFSVLIPGISDVAFLRVELENSRGKIIYSQKVDIDPLEIGQNAVLGILSADYSGLNYFDGSTVDTAAGVVSTKIIQLNANNVPEVSDGLDICDFILIDNYNTSQLSDAQRNAIVGWVNNGGILIFGTGSKASVVLEGFTDTLCPVTVGGLSKSTLTVVSDAQPKVDNVDIAAITTYGWYDVQNDIAYGAPAWRGTYGGGSVLILGYDLAMNPIANWKDGRTGLASNILENAGTAFNYYDIVYGYSSPYDDSYLEDAVQGVDRNKRPNSFLYGFIFLVYVISIGPASYLILKAMNKREKIWFVMPGVSFAFTLIILATSMMYKIHKPFMDSVAIVEYNNGSVTTKNYISVQSPKNKYYEVALAEGYNQVSTWSDGTSVSYDEVGTTDYKYAVIDNADHLSLGMNQNRAFTKQSIMAEKQEYKTNTGFVMNLSCSLTGFSGDVTNNTGYDLTNAVICYGSYCYYIGSFKNGETIQIDENSIESLYSGVYSVYQWMEESPDDYGMLKNSDKNRELRDNENIYRILKDHAKDLEMNQGMVFGMMDGYESDVTTSFGIKVYSKGVAVSYFSQVAEEFQNYTLFINDITDYMVGGDYISYTEDYPEGFDFFYDTTDLYMGGYDEKYVLYDLSSLNLNGAQLINRDMPSSEEQTDEIDVNDLDSISDYYDYATQLMEDYSEEYCLVQFLNVNTGVYEDVFTDGNCIVDDMSPYVDEKGLLAVRYYIDNTDVWGHEAPQISLVGGEK